MAALHWEGMIFSSGMTTKYKDIYVTDFWGAVIYVCNSIVYPLSTINDKYKYLIELNP